MNAEKRVRATPLSTAQQVRFEAARLYNRAFKAALRPDGTVAREDAKVLANILSMIDKSIETRDLELKIKNIEGEAATRKPSQLKAVT